MIELKSSYLYRNLNLIYLNVATFSNVYLERNCDNPYGVQVNDYFNQWC